MEDIVALSVKHYASDLHLSTGKAARWRRQGRLENLPVAAPAPRAMLDRWLSAAQLIQLEQTGQLDFAVTLESGVRLRGHAFHQLSGVSLALRILPTECPDLAQLGVPDAIPTLLEGPPGLLLVTGATGSGKSTTLAAMIGYLAALGDKHILTLEDPIEFIHPSAHGLIQQREIGPHCPTFSQGLRGALREDPDVIVLGELRDTETIRLALTAAETGHLVLGTLHTRGACQAIARLVDVFPAAEKSLVQSQLADALRGVMAQKLVAAPGGGRVGLYELLINTPALANLIREGKTHQLPGVLHSGQALGMQTFEQSLAQRKKMGLITAPVIG